MSVKLNDPSFHGGTIHPVLVRTESGYVLDWKPQSRLREQGERRENVQAPNPPQANAGGDRF